MRRVIMNIKKNSLGFKYLHMLNSMDDLARSMDGLGKHSEAEKLHRALLLVRQQFLGLEHPSKLTSMHNLGVSLDYKKNMTKLKNCNVRH